MAKIVGAKKEEVIVMNGLTVNLHQSLVCVCMCVCGGGWVGVGVLSCVGVGVGVFVYLCVHISYERMYLCCVLCIFVCLPISFRWLSIDLPQHVIKSFVRRMHSPPIT